jgi:hypothetical protein
MQRGRHIFGALVPYGKIWKTGGGFHNRIAFNTDIVVNGKTIPKGEYHIVTIPDPNTWKVILTTDTLVFEQNKPYEVDTEVMRIDVKPERSARHYETFTIDIDIVNNDAEFVFSWDYTSVRFRAETQTTKRVMQQIRKLTMEENASAEQLAQAAEFMAFNITGLPKNAQDTVLLLVNKVTTMQPDTKLWMLRVQADLYKNTGEIEKFRVVTDQMIAELRRQPSADSDVEIARIQAEYDRYKMTSSKIKAKRGQ